MYQLEVSSDLQSEVICSRGWERWRTDRSYTYYEGRVVMYILSKLWLGGWRKCVNYLVFHSRQAGQTVSSVFSSSSNQSESCFYLCTSIRIVNTGSSLVATQNNMQSYFDRPNDTSDKAQIRSYHRIKIAENLKLIHLSGGLEKIFSILGPKLSGSKAKQYYREKTL